MEVRHFVLLVAIEVFRLIIALPRAKFQLQISFKIQENNQKLLKSHLKVAWRTRKKMTKRKVLAADTDHAQPSLTTHNNIENTAHVNSFTVSWIYCPTTQYQNFAIFFCKTIKDFIIISQRFVIKLSKKKF